MLSRRNQTLLSLSIVLGVLAWNVASAAVKGETGVPVGELSVHAIEEQLQVCSFLAYPYHKSRRRLHANAG